MYFLIILFLAGYTSLLFSQQFSGWQNFTDMKNVKSLYADGNLIWAASDGGVFSYNIDKSSYSKFVKVDGLNGVLINAVTVDKYGKVWFGSSNGIIDVYDPQSKTFRSVLDIFITDKSSKKINELTASGDTIFVASDFGISLINANNYLFFDTFSKFGSLPSGIGVNSIFNSGLIYACTDMGIAIQKNGATNLSAPESWNVYTTIDGLPSDSATKLVNYNNSIVATTSRGLAQYNGTSFIPFIDQLNNHRINDLAAAGDSLFILTDKQNISRFQNGELTQIFSSPENNIFKISYSPQGILAATSKGILRLSDGIYLYPNGPLANLFPDLAVDNNGILWSASGTAGSGVGFYRYDGNSWSNFNMSNTPELSSNAYFNLYIGNDNTVYWGSWGQGFTMIKNNNIRNFNVANTGLQGIQNDPNYLVISGIARDSKNNLWILSYGSVDRKILAMSGDLEHWNTYFVPEIGNTYVDEIFHLAIDNYDTKWFAVQRGKQGLFYFNEGNNSDPAVTADDRSGYLNKNSGLNHDFVTAIAVDRRGDVWVGTSLGVNIISNVGSVLSSDPQLRISSVFSLRQQTITAILVDPLNLKWIGTNQGLHLINSDGTSLLASFNSKNSPLLSDEITSLAIDENSGTVYVGTDRGLTSFKTTSVKPKETFDELFVYPNPFILNKENNLITIDGLIRDTDIKILSINGKLVKQFTTPGGRIALWDGRDEFGDLVSSGVYFIVAFDQEGNNVAKTKIAVLRED